LRHGRPCRPKETLSQVGDDPVGLPPSDGSPVGPPRGSVGIAGALHQTCPSMTNHHNGLGVDHQTRVSSLSVGSDDPIRRVMDSPGLSAGGLRFSGLLVPAADSGLPSEDRRAYWTGVPDRNAVAAFRTGELRSGWVLSLPQGLGVLA
jgi:hypothetical protein